ncbi:MAG: GNAT family N-acetyltransferase [Muribaculaceae bacterium]|nr:GNAT family N-acetyltransferase [Muribaculaceae bacterium]
MKLTDGTITLRAPEPRDLDALFRHENAPEAPETTRATAPVSRRMLEKYIEDYEATLSDGGGLRLMITLEETGEAIGSIDLYDYNARDRRAYVSIFVEERMRRQGYAAKALELLCGYASGILGMHQLAAEVAADNSASRLLFEACGFKTCGRLRSWIRVGRRYLDVLIYQRLFFN